MCFGVLIRLEDISTIVDTHDCGPFASRRVPRRERVASQSNTRFTMTTDDTPDDEVSSTEEFEVALGRVIRTALENGVDPRGTWEYRNDGTDADVEVMVVELAD